MKNAITPPKLIIQDLTPCILSDGVARDIELLKNVPISPFRHWLLLLRNCHSKLRLAMTSSGKLPQKAKSFMKKDKESSLPDDSLIPFTEKHHA
jgi:hypothetical protein